ncbi:hypothetical protein [Rhizobium binae]|uniref:hypothetical protein n=1 Tax=Rhizobium binae TaxID=1138190 RepID=UPI001FEE7ACA|nr:hypothetical protein [Rhizobium binae]
MLIVLNLVIFMLFTQPANAILQPDDWETLRRQWKYSHAVNAAVALLAFGCTRLASLR